MRDSFSDFCHFIKLSVPQFPYLKMGPNNLTVPLREHLNNETQDTLIPGLLLSGSKSYPSVLIDIVFSLIKCFVDTTESLFIWLSRSWRKKKFKPK